MQHNNAFTLPNTTKSTMITKIMSTISRAFAKSSNTYINVVLAHLSARCVKPLTEVFFQTWPYLTSALVRKHLPVSSATVMGQKKRIKQYIWSTKKYIPASKNICLIVQPDKITNKLFTNQTGLFLHCSSKGNKYLMIEYA